MERADGSHGFPPFAQEELVAILSQTEEQIGAETCKQENILQEELDVFKKKFGE